MAIGKAPSEDVLTLMGCTSAYGGLPSAISRAVIPRDQTSARQSYPTSCITSGAIQNGVPITVLRLAIVSLQREGGKGLNTYH